MTAVHPSPPQTDDLSLLRHAVEEAARLLDADGAMVYLADDEGKLRFAVDAGIRNAEARTLIRDLSLPAGVGIFGHAIERGEVTVTPDYRADDRFTHSSIADRIVEVASMRSMAAAPLIADGRVLGALGAYSSRVDDFDEARVGLLRALADHAAAGIANRRLIAELDRSRTELARRVEAQQTLGQIAARITLLREPETVLQSIVDAATKLLGTDGAHLTLLDRERSTLRPTVMAGATDPATRAWLATQEFPLERGINGLAAARGALVSTRDYREEPRVPHEPEDEATAERMGLRGMAAAPLRGPEGSILGTLAVSFETPHEFTEDELALLQGLADQGAISISNSRLADELRRSEESLRDQATELAHRVEAQRTLAEMATQISSLRDPSTVLAETLSEAVRLLGARGGQIGIIAAGEDGAFRWSEGHSYVDDAIVPFADEDRTPTEPGVSGWAVRARRTVRTSDYLDDDSFIHTPASDDYVRRHGVRSVMAAPLIGEEGPVGCLAVTSDREDAFDAEDADLLTTLASHAAIVLTNARLYRAAEDANQQLAHRVVAQRALAEIAAQITSIRDPATVLRRTVEEAKRLLEADHVLIHQVKSGTLDLADLGEAFTAGEATPPPAEEVTIAIGQGIAGRAVAERTVILTADYLADDSFDHTERADAWIRRHGYRSQVSAALVAEHGPLGAISAYSTRSGAFGPDEAELLGALASHAAIVLDNASLLRELELRVEAQRALGEIATRITAIREPADVLQGTLDEAVRLLDADGGRIELVDEATGGLHWAYGHSAIDLPIERDEATDPVVPDEGISGLAVTERRVVRTGDYLADHSFKHAIGPDRYVRQHGIRSAMVAPLIGEDGAIGSLTVHSQAKDAFDEQGAQLLEVLASQAAIAVTNARLYERLRERVEAQRSLAEIASQIASLRDSQTVIERAVSDAARLLNADRAQINLARPGADRLDPPIASAPEPPSPKDVEVPIGSGIAGMAAATGSVRWTGDYLADHSFPHDEGDARIRDGGVRSMMAAPLLGPELIGTITVQSTRAHAFGQADAELLQLLADQAAIAVSNARLYDELRARIEAQRTLAEIAAEIAALRDPGAVIQRTADEAVRLLHADAALLNPFDAATGTLDLALAQSPSGGVVDDVPVPLGVGISGRAVAERRVLRTGDYVNDPAFEHTPELDAYITRRGMTSVMTAPLVAGEGPVGALTVQSIRHDAFDANDEELLSLLADQAAIAITNARLYDELTKQSGALARQIDSHRRLLAVNERLLATLDPAQVLEAIADGLKGVVAYDNLAIHRVEPDDQPLRPVLARDRNAKAVMAFPIPREAGGLTWWAIENRKPVLLDDALNDPRVIQIPGTPVEEEAMIIVPLVVQDEVVGALNISRLGGPGVAFTELDFELVQLFATQAAIAMTNARLYDQLKASERRYRHLVDNSPDIVWSLDAEGRFTFLSDPLEARTGWKPEQLLGKPYTVLAQPDSLAEAQAAWELLRTHPDEEQRIRLDVPLADGTVSQAEVAMTGTVVAGAFAGAHGALRDISERERLESDLRHQAAELAASQERAHLARELHDSVTQALFSMGLTLRSLELLLATDPEAAGAKLAELRELQKDALAEMRTLIFELRPASLETDGLAQALRHHAAAVQGRTGLAVNFDAEPIERLPLPVEEALYRIGQEALHNVVKHANASHATIRLRRDGRRVRLEVADDGDGFDPDAIPRGHLGMVGMRQRADLVGAHLTVRSRRGVGTRIAVRVTADAADAADRASAK